MISFLPINKALVHNLADKSLQIFVLISLGSFLKSHPAGMHSFEAQSACCWSALDEAPRNGFPAVGPAEAQLSHLWKAGRRVTKHLGNPRIAVLCQLDKVI